MDDSSKPAAVHITEPHRTFGVPMDAPYDSLERLADVGSRDHDDNVHAPISEVMKYFALTGQVIPNDPPNLEDLVIQRNQARDELATKVHVVRELEAKISKLRARTRPPVINHKAFISGDKAMTTLTVPSQDGRRVIEIIVPMWLKSEYTAQRLLSMMEAAWINHDITALHYVDAGDRHGVAAELKKTPA